jgi:preprotein translocase subunit SecF
MELIRPDTRIDFIGKQKYALVISAIVILISIGSIFLHGGLNYGVDFAGGILLQAPWKQWAQRMQWSRNSGEKTSF